MIDSLISWSIRHRLLVILAALAIGVAGLGAVAVLPVDAIPDLSENQVIVFADWMGHGPREVEDQVTYPLAVRLKGIRGVRVVRSSSDVNFAMVSVIFEDDVEIREARRRVAEKLAGQAQEFPPGVTPYLAPEAPATGQIFWYTVEGPGSDLGRLRAVQDWTIKPHLAGVPGVAEVASVGGFPIEFQVNVDPAKLRARGVTLGAVTNAVARSNSAVGGNVVLKGNAEFLVRGVGWLGDRGGPAQVLRDLEDVPLEGAGGTVLRVADVASVAIGPGPRRGILEKDGSEVVGGVVLMAFGENPLEVTRRIKAKLRELAVGLPAGVKVVPFYDRTPLIEGAIRTVAGTVGEAMLTAAICVLVVLLHARASLIVAATLPLAALASFAMIWLLRRLGIADVQTNVMSLAGIAISVGVLVDSSVVMAENAMHALRLHFGDSPVRGDVRPIVAAACRTVGRPIVFSVAIMLLSFLPVFALGGMEGKMFRPLAVTKSLALASVAVLSITLVPALCSLLIRGRLRGEMASPIVRGVVEVYRPVLAYLMDRPAALAWVIGLTFIVGFTPIGNWPLSMATLALFLILVGLSTRRWPARGLAMGSLVLIALLADRFMTPLGREFLTPLDEGMVMDMPITVPRASAPESGDDLKARDMILCRFPEVEMVVGKAGRAETPTDPAPLDMIETMVSLRPADLWPRRALNREDADRLGHQVLAALVEDGVISTPANLDGLVVDAVTAALPTFDALMREYAYQRNAEFLRLNGPDPVDPPALDRRLGALWREHLRSVDAALLDRAAPTFARLAAEDLLARATSLDPRVAAGAEKRRRSRSEPSPVAWRTGHHHGGGSSGAEIEPVPILDDLQGELASRLAGRFRLRKKSRDELTGFGGELDRAVSMPGWTNVWTMPIQNRVDMLSTGVNTTLGARVLGRDLDDVVKASEAIAVALRRIPGAADVVADPIRGKGYLEVRFDRRKAARLGVSVGDANDAIETALGGKIATSTVQGRERHPVRVRYARARRADEDAVRSVLVPAHGRQVPLAEVAEIRTVEGPATIKGEDGLLRNYVRLNVRNRDIAAFVAEARRAVASSVRLPPGVFVEWTGQFEHEARARRTLLVVIPIVVALIFLVLYKTYDDLADALLMVLAVPGSIAGGVLCQWLLGTKFSVTVWVGYIACFGMATSTGIIMLVYLREAVAKAGGLASITPEGLRAAVMEGAVHRLRPKLLTEGTTILGLAPVLWATGVGAEVIRPMAAPVLGGLLVADEVIDLLLPVLFYRVRLWRMARRRAGPASIDMRTPSEAGGPRAARPVH